MGLASENAKSRPLVELRLQIRAQPVHAAVMVKALRSIMLPARAERGFVSSCIYQEVDSPEALCYVEEWASPTRMEEQIRSRRFGRLLAAMETACKKPVLEIRSQVGNPRTRLHQHASGSVPAPTLSRRARVPERIMQWETLADDQSTDEAPGNMKSKLIILSGMGRSRSCLTPRLSRSTPRAGGRTRRHQRPGDQAAERSADPPRLGRRRMALEHRPAGLGLRHQRQRHGPWQVRRTLTSASTNSSNTPTRVS